MTERVIHAEHVEALTAVFGALDENLRLIEEAFPVRIADRGTEIKIIPTVKAADLQAEADRMSKEIRILDNLLQETNCTKDLIE